MTEVILILLIVLVTASLAVLYYLKLLVKLAANKKSDPAGAVIMSLSTIGVPAQAEPISDEGADIIITPLKVDKGLNSEALPSDLYPKIESLLRAIPSFSSLYTSSGYLFKITFSPEVAKGLSDGTFSLMKSDQNFKAIATDQTGKIIEHGRISPDRIAGTVGAAGAVWQIMAIVTAQKFLSDINKRLAGIEGSLKGLETWLDTEEQGRFLGSYKYLLEVAATAANAPNANDFLIIKTQAERIYYESLQSMAANKLRADAAAFELLNTKFEGGLDESTHKFRKLMDSYFLSSGYSIKFMIIGALSEYLSAYIDRNSEQESKRIESLIQDAENLIKKIRQDAQEMKDKSSLISGRWWNSEDKVNEKRNSLSADMETMLSACEEALNHIRLIFEATKKIGTYSKEIESDGLSLIVQADESGKLISAKSLIREIPLKIKTR